MYICFVHSVVVVIVVRTKINDPSLLVTVDAELLPLTKCLFYILQEDYAPGLLYFVVAGLAALSILCIFCLPETMNTTSPDRITDHLEDQRRKEHIVLENKKF